VRAVVLLPAIFYSSWLKLRSLKLTQRGKFWGFCILCSSKICWVLWPFANKVVSCTCNSGRRITSTGQRDLDQVAGRIVVAL
jgi:hypothetical protein